MLTLIMTLPLAIAVVYYIHKLYKKKEKSLSFYEGLQLTSVPIVTVKSGTEKLNFMLDTGSTQCVLNTSITGSLNLISNNKTGVSVSASGDNISYNVCMLPFEYKDLKFTYSFNIMDMSNCFDSLKEATGCTVHGILGSNFFSDYGYCLDFKNYNLYQK